LKRSGVTDVLSLSAVGSLKAEFPPGHFVIVDQFIDRSFAREKSFFGDGVVAHVSMAHPVCSRLGQALYGAASSLSLPVTRGGTYLVMEGPQFSTKAESELYRSTVSTEAVAARRHAGRHLPAIGWNNTTGNSQLPVFTHPNGSISCLNF
jgi:purine nucleoside phosphorylase